MPLHSAEQTRTYLHTHLGARLPEIEDTVFARVFAITERSAAPDPEYVESLRAAVLASLQCLLADIKHGERRLPQPPAAALIQARLAARSGIGLDTFLRCCFAGYAAFGDFVLQEAAAGELLQGDSLQHLLRSQAAQFDRFIAIVTDEHSREMERRLSSIDKRRAQQVRRLLDGEPLNTSELEYELDAHHLAVVASNPGAPKAIRGLAKALDCRLLLIDREETAAWAWFGSRREIEPTEFNSTLSEYWPMQVPIAIGEPAHGPVGWRLTHRQAKAAFPIALTGHRTVTRYADVALLASILQDNLLTTSLRKLFLAPLSTDHDGRETLCETLRAYFAAERKVSSAAAALGVNRNTVASRLRNVEDKLGRPLTSCATEVEVALRLDELRTIRAHSP
jgi:hypothetical protein